MGPHKVPAAHREGARNSRHHSWSNLLATAVWPALDDETRARYAAELEGFAVAHALNTDRNAELRAQLERVVVRFNAAGIEPIVLKGAAHVATDLWPTPGSRLISDIDLLIDADEIDHAFSVLEDYAGAGTQDRGHPEIIALHKHMLPVIGAGGPAVVELHHTVLAGAAARLAPFDVLRGRAHSIGLGHGHAWILSPTDRVLTAMLHGLAGSGSYIVPTLHMRDMLDIHFLDATYGTDIEWRGLQDHMTSNGWAVALEITNTCLARFTGMTPPFRRSGARAPASTPHVGSGRWNAPTRSRDERERRQITSSSTSGA